MLVTRHVITQPSQRDPCRDEESNRTGVAATGRLAWKNIYFKNRIRIPALNCAAANRAACERDGQLKRARLATESEPRPVNNMAYKWLAGFRREPPSGDVTRENGSGKCLRRPVGGAASGKAARHR